MLSANVIVEPAAFAAACAFSITSGISSKPGGCASTTSMPKRGKSVATPCGTDSGRAYDGAYAHVIATFRPRRFSPRCSRSVIRSAIVCVGWSTSHWRLISGMSAHWAISRIHALPSYGARSWRMAMPSPKRDSVIAVSFGLSPCETWVLSASRKIAWPPSCVMPVSKAFRVRVDLSRNSMYSVLSGSRRCGSPRLRASFSSPATASTSSSSSTDQSSVSM